MAGPDLASVRASLAADGYAVSNGTLEQVERAVQMEHLLFRAQGAKANGSVKHLRPYITKDAPPRSLSAVYGLGAQPLHTDGAHLLEPPDVTVLYSSSPTPTGTAILKPGSGTCSTPVPEAVREGVFVVRGNGFSFLASAYSGRRFRFDPVTMSPGDQMARQAVAWFQEQRDMAVIHQWDQEEQLLFIDNRQALHAREAVVTDSETRVLGRLSLNFVEET